MIFLDENISYSIHKNPGSPRKLATKYESCCWELTGICSFSAHKPQDTYIRSTSQSFQNQSIPGRREIHQGSQTHPASGQLSKCWGSPSGLQPGLQKDSYNRARDSIHSEPWEHQAHPAGPAMTEETLLGMHRTKPMRPSPIWRFALFTGL